MQLYLKLYNIFHIMETTVLCVTTTLYSTETIKIGYRTLSHYKRGAKQVFI
jgi:hypothetical protein